MSYSTNMELPIEVRGTLPVAAQTRFRAAANDAFDRGLAEQRAFATAWHVVKQGWEKDKDGDWMRKVAPRSLYVRRNVKNWRELDKWAKAQGFKTTAGEEMHVTLAFSRRPVDWMKMGGVWEDEVTLPAGGPRIVEPLGDKGAVVLHIACDPFKWRHDQFAREGASWDFPEYQPHITITYDGADVNLDEIEPYSGKIVFGPEIFEEVNENWTDTLLEKHTPGDEDHDQKRHGRRGGSGEDADADDDVISDMSERDIKATLANFELGTTDGGLGFSGDENVADLRDELRRALRAGKLQRSDLIKKEDAMEPVVKVNLDESLIKKADDDQRVAYGWASVWTEKGVPVIDLQEDVIIGHEMAKSITEFMLEARASKLMHAGEQIGTVVHSFPLTDDLAKSLDIVCPREGWLVGVKVHDDQVWKDIKSGKLTAFSIGGKAQRMPVEKAFDPNQPRKPKGDPDGGKWTRSGGGGGGGGENDDEDDAHLWTKEQREVGDYLEREFKAEFAGPTGGGGDPDDALNYMIGNYYVRIFPNGSWEFNQSPHRGLEQAEENRPES